MMTVRESGRMQGLDGLRGLGAMMVVFYHLAKNDLFPHWGIVLSGHVFVMVFFVLSGLVISFSAERMVPFSPRAFMWRRFARVWPLHAAILFAMLGMHLMLWINSGQSVSEYFVGDHSLTSFVASLLLVHDMGYYEDVVWNGPSWSISVEFYAYVVFAALFARIGAKAWIGYVAVLLVALAVIASFGGLAGVPYSWRFFYCLLGFFTGALLFRTIANKPIPDYAPSRVALWQGLLIGAFILSLQFYEENRWLIYLLYPAIVLIVTELAFDRGWLEGLFSSRPFQFLGLISYAAYLSHIPLLNVFTRLEGLLFGFGGMNGITDKALFLGVYFTALILLSWLLYTLIEVPARKILTRRKARPTMVDVQV